MRVGFKAVDGPSGGCLRYGCSARAAACMLAVLVLAACGGGGDSASPTPAPPPGVSPGIPSSALPRIEPYERSAVIPQDPASLRSQAMTPQAVVETGSVPLIALGSPETSPPLDAGPAGARAVAIGRRRHLEALRDEGATAGVLAWQATASGGAIASLRLRSEGAAGVRIGLRVLALPPQALVSVRGQGVFERVSGAQILAALERNGQAAQRSPREPSPLPAHGQGLAGSKPEAAGDEGDDPRLYWLPAASGQEALLQIELPAGVDPGAVRVAVPHLAHLWWTHAAARAGIVPKIGESGGCNADATCSPDYDAQARSVARMEFMRGGFAYLCTGTLMADVAASGLPYFLTAQHCIGDQTTASSLSTYWVYRSSACNSGALDTAATSVHGGAALLQASVSNDTSLLRLLQPPPARAVHAGSLLAPVERGTTLAGLHHPGGDLLKLSVGTLDAYARCDQTRCEAVSGDGDFLSVRWRSGTTESGSSGSPVFATLGSRRYVTGHLFAGTASCQQPDATDFYGRFDKAYPALRPWLGAVPGAPG